MMLNTVSEMRASEIQIMSLTPTFANFFRIAKQPAWGIPDGLRGPALCNTRISSGSTSKSGESIRVARFSKEEKSTALPSFSNQEGAAAAQFIIAS